MFGENLSFETKLRTDNDCVQDVENNADRSISPHYQFHKSLVMEIPNTPNYTKMDCFSGIQVFIALSTNAT